MGFAKCLSLARELLQGNAVRLHRLEQRLVHAGDRISQHFFGIDARLRGAHADALGHTFQDLADLGEAQLATSQCIQGHVTHGGTHVLRLLGGFRGQVLEHVVGIDRWLDHDSSFRFE